MHKPTHASHGKNTEKVTSLARVERHRAFCNFAEKAAAWTGTPVAFMCALSFILFCLVSAPLLHFSHSWEIIATLVPAAVTFLLVFLIQNSQNRETLAVQLKLNELIRATEGAHTTMVNLEKLSEEELVVMCEQYELLASEARKKLSKGETDLDSPEITLLQSL